MATSLFGPMPTEHVRPSRARTSALSARACAAAHADVAERGDLDVRLVDARLLEGVSAPGGDGHDAGRDLAIDGVVAAEEHGLRLAAAPRRLREPPRARDRHRRADAVRPGRVARRGDDAAARRPPSDRPRRRWADRADRDSGAPRRRRRRRPCRRGRRSGSRLGSLARSPQSSSARSCRGLPPGSAHCSRRPGGLAPRPCGIIRRASGGEHAARDGAADP